MSVNLMSPCCKAPVWVAPKAAHTEHRIMTHWYECSACGRACDPIPGRDGDSQDNSCANTVVR